MSTVSYIRPVDGDGDGGSPLDASDLIGNIDQVRGIIYMARALLIEDSSSDLPAHAACALDLANEVLQSVRDRLGEISVSRRE